MDASAGQDRSAKPAPAQPEVLDQKKIHAEYSEGNFDMVLNALEGFQRRNKTFDRQDSVFIAKHLAVVYSANPGTREKGKYYMNRLLELLPSAKLVDMYVSDEIDHIFDKVREEFLDRQRSFGIDSSMLALPLRAPSNSGADSTHHTGTDRKHDATAKSGPGGHTLYWVATGTGAVAAGALAFFLITSDSPSDKTYHVP